MSFFQKSLRKFLKSQSRRPSKAYMPSHFREYCERTLDRCTKIKTLLSRDEPADMLQQYVNVKFDIKRRWKDVVIDDVDAISEILANKRVTITGTAGSGKTVFMRYLWISLFVSAESRIPIFLELRRLNDHSNPGLVEYIANMIAQSETPIDLHGFYSLIDRGRFVFIFDGF